MVVKRTIILKRFTSPQHNKFIQLQIVIYFHAFQTLVASSYIHAKQFLITDVTNFALQTITIKI